MYTLPIWIQMENYKPRWINMYKEPAWTWIGDIALAQVDATGRMTSKVKGGKLRFKYKDRWYLLCDYWKVMLGLVKEK